MNFFGHAHVASWESEDPRFVLGAMLPDFAAMCGVRPVATDPAVEAGIAHHHRADAAFHAGETFRRLCAAGARQLDALGVRRGPSRGAAHAGLEILLDGVLATDGGGWTGYRAALRLDDGVLTFPEAGQRDRFQLLRERLDASAEVGGPRDSLDPAVAGRRLCVALERRPLLAPQEWERPLIVTWLETVRPTIEAATPALLADVRRVLEEKRV